MMDLVVNFGDVALRCDMVFGVLVYCDLDGKVDWHPFASLDDEAQASVRKSVMGSPLQRCLLASMREVIFPVSKPETLAGQLANP